MLFSLLRSALVGTVLLPLALAQVPGFDVFSAPVLNQSVPAGSTFMIKWTPSDPSGTISLILLQGQSNLTLNLGPSIVEGIDSTSGSYAWAVPTNLGDYLAFGIKLQLDTDPTVFQYSPYFSIASLGVPTVIATLPTTASTSTSASASSSAGLNGTTSASTNATITSTNTIIASTSSLPTYANTTSTTSTTAEETSSTTTTARVTTSTTEAAPTSTNAAMGVAVGSGGFVGALLVAAGLLI